MFHCLLYNKLVVLGFSGGAAEARLMCWWVIFVLKTAVLIILNIAVKGIYVIMVVFSDSASFFTFSLLLHLDKMQTSFDLFKI